ncbi:hypothetical protein D3C79_716080 [compost metagenome]
MHVLLVDVRLPGLPAETAKDGFAQGIVPDLVGSATDAVAVAVVGIGIGQNRRFGDGFKQAQADHRRGNTGGETCIGVHRTVTELADLQRWLAQLDLGAVLEGHRHRRVLDTDFAFGGDAGYGHVLELTAIDRLGHDAQLLDDFGVVRLVRNRQAHDHRHGMFGAGAGRMATAILDMAVLAGVGVE